MSYMSVELSDFIKNEAKSMNFKVVHIGNKGSGDISIEIVLDKDKGITLEECASFNKKVVKWIEDNVVRGEKYTVDVSSPGLDRKLVDEDEFKWAINKDICVTMITEIGEKVKAIGQLAKFDGNGDITVNAENGKALFIKKSKIVNARLYTKYKP